MESVQPVVIWQDNNYDKLDYPHYTHPAILKNAQYNGLSDLYHHNDMEQKEKIRQKAKAIALSNGRFSLILSQI